MSKKIYDIVAVTGKYTNSEGVEKRKYQTIGHVFQVKQDQVMMKINQIPLGDKDFHWDGWAYLNVPFEKEKVQNDEIPY